MKYIGWLIFVIVCFPLGQIFHRLGGLEVLGATSSSESGSVDGKYKVVFDEEGGLEVWIDPTSVSPEELPERVVLKQRVEVSSDAGARVTLEQGDKVKVLKLEGLNLAVTALSGPLQGIVSIEGTDFLESVVRIRAGRIFGAGGLDEVLGTPAPTLVDNGGAEEKQEPEQPEPEVVAVVEPKPEPEPEPEPEVVVLTEEDIVRLMRESIQAGTLKEFTFEQVEGWKMSEDEEIDGVPYQIGIAAYKAESIFGISSYKAKALFKDGELTKWVFAKTGMEIR